MTVQSRIDNHERKAAKAAKVLQDARDAAQKSSGYNSQQTRNNIRTKIADCNHGMVARDWQVDVGEAMILGVDCTVIATTGAGKSLPFVMPVLVNPEKVVVIISPLNALEDDLVQRYEKMGLSAVAVNGTCYDKQLHKDVQSGNGVVRKAPTGVFSTPEEAQAAIDALNGQELNGRQVRVDLAGERGGGGGGGYRGGGGGGGGGRGRGGFRSDRDNSGGGW
ncbi:Bloom syndrome [Mycena kentingensis (nom. inval.)]|nr:Bloom syndrome [Mycena kentingensis (nom. inval.)]